MKTTDWALVPASALALALILTSCAKMEKKMSLSPADSIVIINDNLAHRAEVADFMRASPDSPFKRDTTVEFHDLRWFPINPYFRGRSILHRYENPETVSVYGTKGEERKNLRYGYFEFDVPDGSNLPKTIRLNVYKFTPYDKKRYELYRNNLSVWFTDQTTGTETYQVGRYVEVGEENKDPNFAYAVDLNKAYNPYCAYSAEYSCAIPRKEDHIDIALRVGEMKFHD